MATSAAYRSASSPMTKKIRYRPEMVLIPVPPVAAAAAEPVLTLTLVHPADELEVLEDVDGGGDGERVVHLDPRRS